MSKKETETETEMEMLGYFLAIVIGLVMGLIGGGGSILSVPVFVYLFGMNALTATAFSLFVVGITSAFGSVSYIRQKKVDFKIALLFGLPSILGILFSRRLVLPNLPQYIINDCGITIKKDLFILLLFAVLMLISSIKMIVNSKTKAIKEREKPNYTLLVSQGLLVGIVTGFIGAGGGFLIVPALVVLLKTPIKRAIATSLFIISVNSLLGFLFSIDKVEVNWGFLGLFSTLSILGIIFGILIAKKIDGKKLKPIFGWFVLLMGTWIIIKEILNALDLI